MRHWGMFSFLCLLWMNAYAIDCYFTVAKDNCWLNYDVKINIINNALDRTIAVVDIPKGESWKRVRMQCEPKQSFRFLATYSPEFWVGQEGKKYSGKRRISLPLTIKKDEIAWNIPICYMADFIGVPIPPAANKACLCDWSKIMPVKMS